MLQIKKTEFWQIFYFQKTRKSPASRGLSLIAQDIILVLYPPEATFLQSSNGLAFLSGYVKIHLLRIYYVTKSFQCCL